MERIISILEPIIVSILMLGTAASLPFCLAGFREVFRASRTAWVVIMLAGIGDTIPITA